MILENVNADYEPIIRVVIQDSNGEIQISNSSNLITSESGLRTSKR
jgi:hypothetical protein